jgi:sodium-dependent dicarboxylate transporter 2/3/5
MLFFKPEIKSLSRSRDEIAAEYKSMPPMDREEKITMVLTILTIALWLSTPLLEKLFWTDIPVSMPVLFTACLFFFPGVSKIRWKEVEEGISWSGILLVVSGISIGMILHKTEAAEWISVILLGKVGELHPFIQVLAIIIIISMLKIAFTSNTVTGTIVIPIVISLAQNLGLEPLTLAIPAALTSSLAFILVTSSPTNVIPYSAGYFSIKDMAKAGIALTLIAAVIMSTTIFVIGRFMNIY